MAEAGHSSYSASGFEAAMLCPGKPVMEAGKPNNSNIYSATGTCAHLLLEFALKDGREPAAFLGRIFPVDGFDIEVDEDMVTAVDTALANIREMAGDAAILVDPYDPESISNGMAQMLHDSELRYSLIERGRKHALSYTWKRSAEQTLQILEQVAQR